MKSFIIAPTYCIRLILFTKELHQVLRDEGYTHLQEWGYIQEKDYLKDIELKPNIIG